MTQPETEKHTPGPWELFQGGSDYYPGIQADNLSVVVWGEEGENEGIQGHTHQEALANATLIAAAPELLQALEELTKYAASLNGAMWRFDDQPVAKQARAALAKASGQ